MSDPSQRRPPSREDDDLRRQEMRTAMTSTVLDAAARRLSEAIAEYDAALDRRAAMPELRVLDREVARAEREYAAAARGQATETVPPRPGAGA